MARKDFSRQSLQNTNFSGVNLTGALLRYADLRGANFNTAHIQEADFAFAKMDNVSLGQMEPIETVAYSSDGLYVATLDVLGQVKVWNLMNQREVLYLGKPDYFTALSFIPNTNKLAIGNSVGVVTIVEINIKRSLFSLKTDDVTSVSSITADPNGQKIACGKEGSLIEIWDLNHPRNAPLSISLESFSSLIAFTDGGNTVVTSSELGELLFFDCETGHRTRGVKAHEGFIRHLMPSRDGLYLLTSGWDEALLLWHTKTGELIYEKRDIEFDVTGIALISDSNDLMVAVLRGTSITYWRVTNGNEITIDLGAEIHKTFAFAPDGNGFVTAVELPQCELHFWEFPSGKKKSTLRQQLNCLRANIFEVTGLLPHQRRLLLESGAVEIDPVLLEGTGETISHFVRRQRLEDLAVFISERRRRPYSPLILFLGPGTFMSSEAFEEFNLLEGMPLKGESLNRDPKIINSQFDYLYNVVFTGSVSRRRALRAQINSLRNFQGSLRNQYEALISLINERQFSLIIDLDVFSQLNVEMFGLERHSATADDEIEFLPLIRQLGSETRFFNAPTVSYFKLFEDIPDRSTRFLNTRKRLDYVVDRILDEVANIHTSEPLSLLWTGFYPRRGLRRLPRKHRLIESRVFWVASEELRTLPELKQISATWVDYPVGRFAEVFSDLYRIIGYSPPEEDDAYLNIYQIESLAESKEVAKRIRAAEVIVSRSIEMRSKSQSKRVLAIMTALSRDHSSEVRRAVLSNILQSFFDIPFPVSDVIRKYAEDPDDFLKGDVAKWILSNYERVRSDFEELLFELAKSRSAYVRRCIIDTIRSRFEQLPAVIRKLASDLVGTGLSIALKSGGGMLVETPSSLVLNVINHNLDPMSQVDVEIVGSGDYAIESSNIVSLRDLQPEKPQEVAFTIRPRVPLEFSVSIKVNGEIKEPALRIVAIKDNPYVYGNPIDSPTAFFGRQRELDDIFQAVTKPNKQDILLVGERRSGKTSLLYQLLRRFQAPYIPVYVVINEAAATIIGVIRLIVRKIISSLVERDLLAPDPWNEYKCTEPSLTDNLAKVFDAARQNISDLRIVLLVDEGDYLLSIDDQLQNILRAGLQSKEVGPYLRAVVAGTSSLSTYVSNKSSPFFNHFRFVTLTPLNKTETESLITKPAGTLGYIYKSEAITEISLASGGQPYYCQRICYEAFDVALKRRVNVIDKEIAWQAIQHVIESPSDDAFKAFKTYFWEAATPEERDQMLSLVGVGKYRASRVFSNRLVDWQIVIKKEKTIEFSALLFEKWVERLAKTI